MTTTSWTTGQRFTHIRTGRTVELLSIHSAEDCGGLLHVMVIGGEFDQHDFFCDPGDLA